MKRTTAFKVLAAGYLLIVVGSLASEQGRENLPALLFGGLVVGFFVYLAFLREEPRREALRAEARRLGLSFSREDPSGIIDIPFDLFGRTRRSYGALSNVLSGSWESFQVRAFDYTYSVSEDEVRECSCAMVAIPGGWPALAIRPETPLTSIADHLALPDIGFESERFNRTFEVSSDDRRFASAVVDARMMSWLLSLVPRCGFEIRGRWILAYRDRVQPWEIGSVLSLVSDFVDRIPGAVRSLFPEALPPRPDAMG
ncbi:MAG TPA: hypothetical protein VE669_11490 [Actinomycetota bacterium]|nr:hypothetical protein [Actinomycetota bacterium]